jgi:phosphatidylglycerol:prolipoprotein diacylglycerol transferase
LHPWIFTAFGREIRWYGLGYALTLLIGANLSAWLLRKRGHNGDKVWDAIIWFIPISFLGARLVYVLTNLDEYVGQGWEWIRIDHGGISFHGGIVAGVLVCYFYFKNKSPNFWQVMDSFAVPTAMGICFVRIGNFMNGDITGHKWNGPWAMNFPYDELHDNVYLGPGNYILDPQIIPRHPTEIYGFLVGVIVLLVVIASWRMRKYDGFVYYQFILWYSIVRSVIEEPFRDVPHLFYKWSYEPWGMGGITTTQWVSIGFAAYALIGMYWTPRLQARAALGKEAREAEIAAMKERRKEGRSRKKPRG